MRAGGEGSSGQDPFLEERLARVDRWLREGKISFSSRVVPVGEALGAQQWVLPTEQVLEVVATTCNS